MNRANKNSRNKENYFRLIEKSLAITLLLMIVSFQSFKKFEGNKALVETKNHSIIIEEIPITKIDKRRPPPIRPKVPVPTDDPEIPDELTITETELLFDAEYPVPPEKPTIEVQSFDKFDSDPEPIGGLSAIEEHLKYPEYARRAGIQGKVVIKALIDEKGNVIQWEFLESIGFGGCDEAALSAMKKTRWKPAIRNLKPTPEWVTIPFTFRLVYR